VEARVRQHVGHLLGPDERRRHDVDVDPIGGPFGRELFAKNREAPLLAQYAA
jgi:hypothetical protein